MSWRNRGVRQECHNVPTIVHLCLSRVSLTVGQAKLWREDRGGGSRKRVSGHASPELTSFSFSLVCSLMYTHTQFILSPDVPRVNVCKRTDSFRRFPLLNPVKMSLWWQFGIVFFLTECWLLLLATVVLLGHLCLLFVSHLACANCTTKQWEENKLLLQYLEMPKLWSHTVDANWVSQNFFFACKTLTCLDFSYTTVQRLGISKNLFFFLKNVIPLFKNDALNSLKVSVNIYN